MHLIVNAADTPLTIKNEVLKYCYKYKTPFITGGIGIKSGHWGPLLDNLSFENGMVRIKKDKLLESFLRSQTAVKGSSGFTNNIISSYLSYDVIMYLIGRNCHSYQKKCSVNFDTLEIKKIQSNEIIFF
ncbi:hypothetical protein [Staphylococcus chromogenes]|uniref:hypothetical protein n=1 Tax=Staphylococcus chromogenes TaxID=46126 RepID=UPI00188F35A9|nr:hypothetical protein [Staphylococcus chromogenes]